MSEEITGDVIREKYERANKSEQEDYWGAVMGTPGVTVSSDLVLYQNEVWRPKRSTAKADADEKKDK